MMRLHLIETDGQAQAVYASLSVSFVFLLFDAVFSGTVRTFPG